MVPSTGTVGSVDLGVDDARQRIADSYGPVSYGPVSPWDMTPADSTGTVGSPRSLMRGS